MNIDSTQSPSQPETFSSLNSEQTKSKIIEELPFPPPPSLVFSSKLRKVSSNPLLKEIEQILHIQTSHFEKNLKAFEEYEENGEIADGILEVETWNYESVNMGRDILKEGLCLLDDLFPLEFFEKLPSRYKIERLHSLASVGNAFIGALNLGSHQLALNYRAKILEQSRELLERFKTIYQGDSAGKNLPSDLTPDELKRIHQKLKSWETRIEKEKEVLKTKQFECQIDTISYIFSLISIPLNYFPKNLFKYVSSVLTGLSGLSCGLEVISTGIELHTSRKEVETIHRWATAYQAKLDKPRSIIKKKNLTVQPSHLAEKVKKLKQSIFIRETQQLLWHMMQDTPSSDQLFHEYGEKWKFFSTPMNKNNRRLIQTFRKYQASFKSAHETLPDVSSRRERLIKEFHQWMQHPTAMDEHFQNWYSEQSEDALIQFYANYQEAIENTIKNALQPMVQKKYEIEHSLSRFKLFVASIHCSMATITLVGSIALGILGILSIPFGGAGIVLLAIAIASIVINLGLLGTSHYYIDRIKPHMTKTLSLRYQAKIMWARMQSSAKSYFHRSKEKELLKAATILYPLQCSIEFDKEQETSHNYLKALDIYKKAKSDFDESQEKMAIWTKQVKELETHLTQQSWLDFAEKGLQIKEDSRAFEILHLFQEAFQACDVQSLSKETLSFFEKQLGMDLRTLHTQIQKEPQVIQDLLVEFFTLDQASLASFIRNQETH